MKKLKFIHIALVISSFIFAFIIFLARSMSIKTINDDAILLKCNKCRHDFVDSTQDNDHKLNIYNVIEEKSNTKNNLEVKETNRKMISNPVEVREELSSNPSPKMINEEKVVNKQKKDTLKINQNFPPDKTSSAKSVKSSQNKISNDNKKKTNINDDDETKKTNIKSIFDFQSRYFDAKLGAS